MYMAVVDRLTNAAEVKVAGWPLCVRIEQERGFRRSLQCLGARAQLQHRDQMMR